MEFEILNDYAFLVGIKETGRRILNKITKDDIDWFLKSTIMDNKTIKTKPDELSLEKKTKNYYIHQYIKKCFIDDFTDINFVINPSNPNCVVVVLIYDEEEYENVKEFKKNLTDYHICCVDICINDSDNLALTKVINTKEEDAIYVILNMLILMLPCCPGIIAFDHADYESFMEDGFKYGSIFSISNSITDAVEQIIKKTLLINNIDETLSMAVGKHFSLNDIMPLKEIKGNNICLPYRNEFLNDYRILRIYKKR